jgi:serine/threonine-protein kinase
MTRETPIPTAVEATFGRVWTGPQLASTDAADTSVRTPAPEGTRVTLRGLSLGPDGDLEALELLGQGGMGTVHAAHDRVLDRVVALKRPKGEGNAGRALVAEARTLARMDHPNVVPVHTLAADERGEPVVVMKRIQGRRWTDLARERADLERDLEIALEVADALRFAHARGVLHRDLKPDNVMVGEFGEVYLMDWGCACAAEAATTTTVCGTPAYMAPEMCQPGAAIGPATDVFLLGAALHRVLTGHARNAGKTLRETLDAAWRALPAEYPPPFPEELAAILNRACARDLADRFPTVEAFAAALRGFRGHREAADLAAASLRALPDLEAALAAGNPRADTLYAELRLGLRTALRSWPEHPHAAADLAAATERFLAWKLGLGELAAAEALLPDLAPEPRARWTAEVARVRTAREREQAQARAHDLSVAARERALSAAIVVVSAVVLTPVAVALRGTRTFDRTDVLVAGVVSLVLVLGATLPFWRSIAQHRASRSLILGIVLLVGGALAHRSFAWFANASAADSLRSEAVWMMTGLAMLSLGGEAALALAGMPYLLAAVGMVLWPDLAGFLFPFAALPSAAITLLVFLRRLRASAAG